jgi:hypothetical protein
MRTAAIVLSVDARVGRRLFAPVKLATAVLLAAGVAVRNLSVAGAASALAISAVYVVRLLGPDRRDRAGLVAFILVGLLAGGVLALRLPR